MTHTETKIESNLAAVEIALAVLAGLLGNKQARHAAIEAERDERGLLTDELAQEGFDVRNEARALKGAQEALAEWHAYNWGGYIPADEMPTSLKALTEDALTEEMARNDHKW